LMRKVLLGFVLVGMCLGGVLACSQLPLREDGGPVSAIPLEWLRAALRDDPIVNLLASAGIGAVLGALVSWAFALQSGKQLRTEADRLRRLGVMLVNALQNAGVIEGVIRDAQGEPINVVVSDRASPEIRVGLLHTVNPAGPASGPPPTGAD
jgi:hypothetical protein